MFCGKSRMQITTLYLKKLCRLLLQLLHKVDSDKARVVKKKKKKILKVFGHGVKIKIYILMEKKKSPTGLGLGTDSSYSPYYA